MQAISRSIDRRGSRTERRVALVAALVALATGLAACGSGGDDAGTDAAPAPTATLTLTGRAATGAPIAGGPVDVRCASGSGSAVTGADGSYTVTIPAGALPCVARVTPATGPALHSLARGSAASATAQITPATQLVVAQLAAADPATWFKIFPWRARSEPRVPDLTQN